jgi:O-antigen ligase
VICAIRGAIKKRLFYYTEVNKYLLLIIIIGAFSICIKSWIGEIQGISITEELIYFKNWSNPLILFFVVVNIVDDRKTCNNTLFGLLVFIIITALTMFLGKFGIISFAQHISIQGRTAGFGNPNEYAILLVLFLPLLISYFFFNRNPLIKITLPILIILILSCLFLTASRSGFLSLCISMFFYFVILKREQIVHTLKVPVLFALLAVLLIVGFVATPSSMKNIVIERFDPSASEDLKAFTSGRPGLWLNGLRLFIERPVFGHGQNTFIAASKARFRLHGAAHSLYIKYLAEYGIVGFMIITMVFIKIFQHVWRHIKIATAPWPKQLYICYVSGFLGWVFSLMAAEAHLMSHIFWIYTAIIFRYPDFDTNSEKSGQ